MNLNVLGWNSQFEKEFADFQKRGFSAGRIVAKQNHFYTLFDGERNYEAKITGKFRHSIHLAKDFPTVGDWVTFERKEGSEIVFIHTILPRKSSFSRKQPISGGRKIKNGIIVGGSTEEQVIASNIDTVFIVSGLDQDFDIRRIERYLTLAYNSGATPVILLNKMDLCDKLEECKQQVEEIAVGVPVHAISVETEVNMNELFTYLTPGKTVVFLGSSGVGKSTITNYLLGEEKQKRQETSKSTGKGKHTTTGAQLILHQSGFMIIDTPGLREVQLWGGEHILEESFQDVISLIRQCRFKNCSHRTEPGCAIKFAIDAGTLSTRRLESYLKQFDELFALQNKRKKLEVQINKRVKQRRRLGL